MSMRRMRVLGILWVGVFCLGQYGGCPFTIVLNEESDGGAGIFQVGDVVRLELGSNPSTGYAWEITELDGTVLEMIEDDFNAGLPIPGAPGTAWWRFRMTGAGQATLRLEYRRPWEQEEDPADIFTYTFNVGGPVAT